MASATAILLTGKTAIVTGGTRGIGAGISRELALRGANIAMVFANPDTADAATAYAKSLQISNSGIGAISILADLSDPESPGKIVKETLANLKVEKIDIVVNNAALGDWTSTPDITVQRYDAVMNTNVRGPILLVKEALPYIPHGGRIINISSYATRDVMIGPGVPDMALYICSKIALEGLTSGWAVEFGQSRGITVNSVSVGPTETDLIASMPEEQKAILKDQLSQKIAAAPRWGTPDDVAQVVAFLASESARWVSGSTVSANGGIITL